VGSAVGISFCYLLCWAVNIEFVVILLPRFHYRCLYTSAVFAHISFFRNQSVSIFIVA